MLPAYTSNDMKASEDKRRRGDVARHAANDLQLYILDKPDMRYAVGNLPVLWHVLAVEGSLSKRVTEASEQLDTLPASFDSVARKNMEHRLAAMQHFERKFTAGLHAA